MATPTVDHYSDRYWNEHPVVLAYLQRRSTGDAHTWWMDHVKARYASPKPFRHGLVIGCGNGWVERDLFDRGVAERFDAFDVSPSYVEQAEAQRGDRSIRYFQSDFRGFEADTTYDLIVNVSALHHAQHLYRMVRQLWRALEPDGLFVNWDYVGPSRNQYSEGHVRLMQQVNLDLPERFRTPHELRPALQAVVAGDPTEAVHSAEILPAIGHWFDFVEHRTLGGGVAYQLLWNNLALLERTDPEGDVVVSDLLRLDEAHTDRGDVPVMFAFFVCRRRSRPRRLRAAWHRLLHEPVRETIARRSGGLYPRETSRLVVARHPLLVRAVRAIRLS